MIRPLALALAAAVGLPALAQEEIPAPLQERSLAHQKDVTTLRGLEFKKEVVVGIYSKDELTEFLKKEFEKELPREKAALYQRGLVKFGLLPPDLDLYDAYLKLLSSAIAGFYHPKTKELRLIQTGGPPAEEADMLKAFGIDLETLTLVHELTHAAQDQNFELSTLPLDNETNDDLIMALRAAIEGDASVVGWKFALKDGFKRMIGIINSSYKTGMLPGEGGKLPAYLRLTLTFPYGHGTDFVIKVLDSTGDASELFLDLPLSTEQILHPEKYHQQRDNPTLIELPGMAEIFGDPWKESFNNVHGEFSVRLLLKEFKSPTFKKASEGWDGDRYVVLENGSTATAYVWLSTWDSEEDAREFHEAYALALEKKYDKPPTEGPRGKRLSFETGSGHVLLELRGTDVLAIDGAPETVVGKAETIWSRATKSEMTSFERLRSFLCPVCGLRKAFAGTCPRDGAGLDYREEENPPPPGRPRREY